MPELVDKIVQGSLARIMCVGDAMLRKTTWAVAAAEEGFNVIYIDGDGNNQPLYKLSDKAKARVKFIDGTDTPANAVMAWICYYILAGNKFNWREDTKSMASGFGVPPETAMLHFDASKLTNNDILIFDSWTAYCKSLLRRYMQEEQIDLAGSVTVDSDWKDYRWSGLMADWFLEQLKTMPCHVIVIAHNELHEKKDKKGNVLSSKLRAISTSRGQADKLPKYFTEIIYFELAGSTIYLDTKPSDLRVAGTRSCTPFREEYSKMQFRDFAAKAGIKSTGVDCAAVKFGPAAEILSAGKAPPPTLSAATDMAFGKSSSLPGFPVAPVVSPPKVAQGKVNLGSFLSKGKI